MVAVTRLGLDGYGVRRAGSFAGKTAAGAGAHPVGVIARLGLDGYGVRRAGDFSGKTAAGGGGAHPVGIITRLSLDGYGVKRAGDFTGKTEAALAPAIVTAAGGATTRHSDRGKRRWKRFEDDYTPEELAREIALIEQHLDRARNAKRKKDREREAAEAAERIEAIAKADEQAAEAIAKSVVASVDLATFDRSALKADLGLIEDIIGALSELARRYEIEMIEEEEAAFLLLLV